MSQTAPEIRLTRARGRPLEKVLRWLFFACAAISVLTTLAVVGVLSVETFYFFQQVPASDFLFGTRWTPLLEPKSYGILPLLFGTTLIVIGAAIVALPVGLACAIYLSEYAGNRTRDLVKPILEILAGIPTIVYGFFAITFVTPILRTLIPSTEVFNAASAGIVVGIMVLPMVASLCDDALRAVPNALRDGAYSLGATSFEVTARIVVPASLSGIFAAFVLAISRAIGETMAVTLAAGATPNLTLNPLESIQTMTAYIVQVSLGDTPAGTLSYQTLFAVGAVLFSMTLVLNLIANAIMNRYRDVYE
ncbi:MAG: phosphate ABC transporter permease subunit PstC [Gammaproteobacteria bacterium]|jgi:phosphate transport system permease protein|nr:phosphate ABC transporter permease subunit PstC [Gammaproteobacteria bacterium]MDA7591989.1 phosphate ABC transporter permease subunit PstC [Pseudomonadales bacterium]MBT5464214.1 phosphate ABC transporter permease subunit PstC [Gammaproteobacteria bacterium]MBT6792218.1 phosphate ABC transporter permease subunit PstC [Gammaproteobacteria bacterium]MBT7389784.1 phosphate ABC transporter permease subunit PstC [Gammaproteobacteria bacterium]